MADHELWRIDDELLAAAKDVLDGNWTGRSTVPSPSLYPHQWSWDSGFIAIGLSWYRQERAQRELESLFAAQWADGRIPHIVFNPAVPADAYFPGPDFWGSAAVPDAPRGVATSGIIQPPIHARAALEVYEHASDRAEALAFLRRLYPKLDAWHRYLIVRRDPNHVGLAAVLHPWESGLDNSPTWEGVLGELRIPQGALPPYRRSDLAHADPADRPTAAAYDRFAYLVSVYRSAGYDDARICESTPFLIAGPLVNALLVWSLLGMAEIAQLVGDDPAPHLRLATTIRAAAEKQLWDADDGRYYIRDMRREVLVRDLSILSFMPLVDPQLPARGVDAIVRDLSAPNFHPPEGTMHFVVPSYDLTGALFDPRRYWRGPVWINTDWLIWRGLLLHARAELAAHVAASMLALVRRSGFREYFEPFTGAGHGGDRFSWTAALIIDLIERRRRAATAT